MSDNPNHLLWRERTYEVRMAGCRRVMPALSFATVWSVASHFRSSSNIGRNQITSACLKSANRRPVAPSQIFPHPSLEICGIGLPFGPIEVKFAVDLHPIGAGWRIGPLK
jgi:hypothetical protein